MNNKRHAAVIAIALFCVSPAKAAVNLVVDGDFSQPNLNGGYNSTETLAGWNNLTETYLEIGGSTIYGLACANTVCQNLEVNDNTFDTVATTVSGLVVGARYNFDWLYGGRPGGGAQELVVSIGGAQVAVDTGSLGVWTANTDTFVATATSELLQFASVNVGGIASYGNEITNVSVTAVPEPASWLSMLAGFALLGANWRRLGRAARQQARAI